MEITPGHFSAFLSDVAARSGAGEQALNAADARLGDGDTGSMLRRVVGAMAACPADEAASMSDAAKAAAQAAMKETGSSLGTLVATAMMTLTRETQTRGGGLSTEDLPAVVTAIADAISARGKAAVGDKTVVDSAYAIAKALADGPPGLDAARKGAIAALAQLRDQPCRIGRARMFPERSVGADDPGMLAVAILLGAAPATTPNTNPENA